tara:strand:- start:4196 stop:5221 length:1026 start_codon:yes stop_codon:yes gene_type:complete
MKTINVGLLGYGMAGKVFHAPLIQSEPRMTLRTIGSRTFTDKTLPKNVAAADIDAVISDPLIDLIVVATPNSSHAPLAQLALEAGKHVVIDKPFALSEAEAQRVIEAARAAGRIVSVFQNRRWDGGFLTARRAVQQGRLGKITYAELHFDRYSPAIKDRWREYQVPGAGILYDLGPHLLDQILCLFGMPDALTANLAAQRPGARVDDFFHIICDYGPVRVVAHASSLMPDHAPRIALYGDDGSLFQYGLDGQEMALKAGMTPAHDDWGLSRDAEVVLKSADGQSETLPILRGRYDAFYANIADVILEASPCAVPPEQALQVMRMLDAAQQSAADGCRIGLA